MASIVLHNKVNREELKQQLLHEETLRTTISFYCYYHLGNPQLFRDHIFLHWSAIGVYGRIYVAHEGINAQISVPTENLDLFKQALNDIVFLRGIRLNYAIEDNGKSFFKLAIKVRPKLVADGLDDKSFDVTNCGTHLKAAEFNQITSLPNTVVVDMRNHYEHEVGYFEDAILPDVDSFREALPVVEAQIKGKEEDYNIVMYCTGGIRCEKASAYYKHKGFKNVFQLEGGIIEYARQVHKQGLVNKFKGKNFVFDERLGERIGNEILSHCHQCGAPCDTHTNCVNAACHLLFIQCPACAEKYSHCCSVECADFTKLPAAEQARLRRGVDKGQQVFHKGRASNFAKTIKVK
jgi:UPF0176 protein